MEPLTQIIGQVNRYHAVAADYEKTLHLLQALKAGRVALDEVQLTDAGWNLVPAGQLRLYEPGPDGPAQPTPPPAPGG